MRSRIRDLGITIGTLPPGAHNAITDVPGVLVGHTTVWFDEPQTARTGVTVIAPNDGNVWTQPVFAGSASFNGCGEMTGLVWIGESGMLSTPIAITSTTSVGNVWSALTAYGIEHGFGDSFLPVVAETHDGWLNDLAAQHVQREHVYAALGSAAGGPVTEGCVGGGTGMTCHEFKGGIGTASRVADCAGGRYHVGALVQANYGERATLRVDGVPIGRLIGTDVVPGPSKYTPGGSIIIVVATDAPLLPHQCQRLACRATVGLARVGGIGHNGSGDIFLAFSTGNATLAPPGSTPVDLHMLPNNDMNALFSATAEAVEEAILNALCMAETTTGIHGHVAHALPLDTLQEWMQRAQL